MHWRKFHQECVFLFKCPVAGCSFTTSRRGQFTRYGNFRHHSTMDPLPVNVTNPNTLMPLAPMSPGRDMYRKKEARNRRIQTSLTAGAYSRGKWFDHFVVVIRSC